MPNLYARHLQNTPQTEPLPDHPGMVKNAAGGFVFPIDDWQRLERFLILGCEGGTYYAKERELTLENAACVVRCLQLNGPRVVREIVRVSHGGLAPKNDPAIFALALATVKGDEITKHEAFLHLDEVCRIGTHLFQFVAAREALGGGWGRRMRQSVSDWYVGRVPPQLIEQALKYKQRDGWSHRDVLRLAHPKLPKTDVLNRKILDAICRPDRWAAVAEYSKMVANYIVANAPGATSKLVADCVREGLLSREMIPTEHLKSPEVWEALLPHMGLTALLRNLGNLSKVGLLTPLSDAAKVVAMRLTEESALRKARVHPFAVLLAARTYGSGRGFRGDGAWTVVPQVVDALDSAFYMAFHNVVPTNKRHLLAIDVSSSMCSAIGDSPMSAAEAAAAMSMATARVEPSYFTMGFSTKFVDLGITAGDSLKAVLAKTTRRNFGGTNTAIAIDWALKTNTPVDVFVVYTDNETWAGDTHTCEILARYRQKTGIASKLAVVAFTATNRTVMSPDPGSMDFVGLDASLPAAIAGFVGRSGPAVSAG